MAVSHSPEMVADLGPEKGVAVFNLETEEGREVNERLLKASDTERMLVVADICRELNVRALRITMSADGGTSAIYLPFDSKVER